jgi:hypothetical protein
VTAAARLRIATPQAYTEAWLRPDRHTHTHSTHLLHADDLCAKVHYQRLAVGVARGPLVGHLQAGAVHPAHKLARALRHVLDERGQQLAGLLDGRHDDDVAVLQARLELCACVCGW